MVNSNEKIVGVKVTYTIERTRPNGPTTRFTRNAFAAQETKDLALGVDLTEQQNLNKTMYALGVRVSPKRPDYPAERLDKVLAADYCKAS